MELRQYQKQLLSKLFQSLKTHNRVLVQAPTGAGKTVMISAFAKYLESKKRHALVVTNRLEILQQFGRTMINDGIGFSIIHDNCNVIDGYIVLTTIQTLYRRELEVQYDYIFFDEIHDYYNKKMYNRLLTQYKDAKVISFTATPIDSKGYLLPDFDDYITDLQIPTLVEQGYLCHAETYINNDFDLDLKLLKVSNGEYNVDDVKRFTATLHNMEIVFNEYCKFAKDKKTIFFCSSIEQAQQYCDYFASRGVKGKVISSHSYYHERIRAIADFRDSQAGLIFNVNILTTGFDEPSVEVIGLLNPTKILRKYIQCCGRGLRKAEGKEKCLILDFVQNYQMHGDINDIRHYKVKDVKVRYKDCPICGYIVESHIQECPQCEYIFDTSIEVSKGNDSKVDSKMRSLEKAFNYQQLLIQRLTDVIRDRMYKPGYIFFLLKDILANKPSNQSTVNYYRCKLSQLDKVVKNGYKLNYIRYNHGKYAEATFGVSHTNDVPPMVQKEQFYNALMARTQRNDVKS
jgi:DNA repair protein RadD